MRVPGPATSPNLARGAAGGGATRPAKGGPYGRTNGAKRVVAVDVTGFPLAALVVPASCTESAATELVLEQLEASGQSDRLEVAHGRAARSRRLAKSFENTAGSATGWLQVACLRGVLAAC